MATFTAQFHKMIQDSQEFGSSDEHMVSRVFFSLYVDEKKVGDCYADLKQVVGTDFESGNIEISPPHGYDGVFDHQRFSDVAKKYFQSLVGPQGSGIKITGGSNIRMRNNQFHQEAKYNF